MPKLARMEHLRDIYLSLGDHVPSTPPIAADAFPELRRLCLKGYAYESDYVGSLISLTQIIPRDIALERLDIRYAAIGQQCYRGDVAAECRGLELLVTRAAKTLGTWMTVYLAHCHEYAHPASYAG